jgi:hypothetical protein
MSKKQEFIDYVEEYLFKDVERVDIPDNVWNYWEAFKGQEEVEKPMFTDNGKLILKYMQDTVSEVPMQRILERDYLSLLEQCLGQSESL